MNKVNNVNSMVVFPANQMEKFNEYQKQYDGVSNKQIMREIIRVKGEVSQEVVDKHIKNLDALASMDGFVTDLQRRRIEQAKSLLKYPNTPQGKGSASNIGTEYVSGSSLLLWFLLLTAIW